MKQIGRIVNYNGHFGKIVEEDDIVDFSKKDINQQVEVGDVVEYRKEEREPNLKLARNIKILFKAKDSNKNS